MGNPHGSYIWYELMTPDPVAATRFYGDVVGWSVDVHEGMAGGGGDYRILNIDGGAVGGMLEIGEDMRSHGARPTWIGYFGVDDVDRSVASIQAAGGQLLMPPMDVPNVGRMAMATDPQGLPFYVMRGASDGTSNAFDGQAIGHCAWNELVTSDLSAALDFYAAEFNIAKGDTMPMGPAGDYQFIDHAGRTIGGAMQPLHADQPLGWTYYFRVADIDSAHENARGGGATIMMEPHQVPGGDWVVIGVDPQGARFGLVGARKS